MCVCVCVFVCNLRIRYIRLGFLMYPYFVSKKKENAQAKYFLSFWKYIQ